jgi:hypothetical protein
VPSGQSPLSTIKLGSPQFLKPSDCCIGDVVPLWLLPYVSSLVKEVMRDKNPEERAFLD